MTKEEIVNELLTIGCEKLSEESLCLPFEPHGSFYFDLYPKSFSVVNTDSATDHPSLGYNVFFKLKIEKITQTSLKDLFSCYTRTECLASLFKMPNG